MRWLFYTRNQMMLALALCAVLTVAAWFQLAGRQNTWQHWLGCWLLAANVVAFAFYALDKWLAQRIVILRVAENVLHTLAGVGGSPAALLAMLIFRHKTVKPSFRILFVCILVVQIALAAYVVKLLWWT
jgi:uncharacterized membrane protein YsdA (DUF1294 family)